MSILWILACRYSEMFRYVDVGGIFILIVLLGVDCITVLAFLK